MQDVNLRYPIGEFLPKERLANSERTALIQHIADAPSSLRTAVAGLVENQLDTPYRDGGWTVRQVVHHVPDSHLNAYIRFKLALTEDNPTIKPYDQQLWAELHDARTAPVEPSLALLDSLHPENGTRNLDWLLQLYAWHGRHHTAHITSLRRRMGW